MHAVLVVFIGLLGCIGRHRFVSVDRCGSERRERREGSKTVILRWQDHTREVRSGWQFERLCLMALMVHGREGDRNAGTRDCTPSVHPSNRPPLPKCNGNRWTKHKCICGDIAGVCCLLHMHRIWVGAVLDTHTQLWSPECDLRVWNAYAYTIGYCFVGRLFISESSTKW